MASKILINATHHEEVRVAIIENNKLMEYDHDRLDNINKKGSIYKGIVSRIEPSLNAAFIDYGENRHGFLPAAEVSPLLYPKDLDRSQKHSIQHILKKDQEILIQVEKEEQGNKGAALTTNISLAGCYIVLMPATPDAGGISRQIDGEDRDYLQRVLNQIDIPQDCSIILRTASIGRSLDELLWDFNILKSQWEAMYQYSLEKEGPILLYKEGALLSRVIRDYLKPNIQEILIDEPSVYNEVLTLVQHIRPDFLSCVQYFDASKGIPLFAKYQIEHEIESIFNPEVVLDNGSTLVFDHREALTSIDINSARLTTATDITSTAFKTNLAAATEIARQIRLRNIGGQIVIDFIHMSSSDQAKQSEQARQVEAALKQGLSGDKARIQVGKISKLGLLEISRQRLKTALDKSQLMTCQNCHGRGTHRQPQSVALSILRLIEQEALHYRKGSSIVRVHATIAEYLFNTYRQSLCDIEKNSDIVIQIQFDLHKSAGDYEISFYSNNNKDSRHPERTIRNYIPSPSPVDRNAEGSNKGKSSTQSAPSYSHLMAASNPNKGSWLSRLWRYFFGPKIKKITPKESEFSENSEQTSDHRNTHAKNHQHKKREYSNNPHAKKRHEHQKNYENKPHEQKHHEHKKHPHHSEKKNQNSHDELAKNAPQQTQNPGKPQRLELATQQPAQTERPKNHASAGTAPIKETAPVTKEELQNTPPASVVENPSIHTGQKKKPAKKPEMLSAAPIPATPTPEVPPANTEQREAAPMPPVESSDFITKDGAPSPESLEQGSDPSGVSTAHKKRPHRRRYHRRPNHNHSKNDAFPTTHSSSESSEG